MRILTGLGEFWDSGSVRGFACDNRHAFWTNAGRHQILWGVDMLVAELSHVPLERRGEPELVELLNFISTIRRLATTAFCVRARRLVPGLIEDIPEPATIAEVDVMRFQLPYDEAGSDGSDSDESE